MNRRDFLKNSSLVALGSTVPEFLARTAAAAAEPGKDNVLVVLEMNGGNDGLNTVVPYADDRYYKYRPTLGIKKADLRKVNDQIGLHPRLTGLQTMLQNGSLAIVQGVGYPNPDRSHFESMDVWQSADPKRAIKSGWMARTASALTGKDGGILGVHVGPDKLPLALTGSAGIVSLGDPASFELNLSGTAERQKSRKKLLEDLSKPSDSSKDDLSAFVQRRQLRTLKDSEKIREAPKDPMSEPQPPMVVTSFSLNGNGPLMQQMQVVARLIQKGLGTRLFYVSIGSFDTHAGQAETHGNLLGEVSAAIEGLFNSLGDDKKRVLLMTYSEFGRRTKENGSKGTDHGAASCLFVAGPSVKAGPVGKYPSLGDLDDGDLKFQLDFRNVYATLLDNWLGCDSKSVLGEKFETVDLIGKKG